MHAKQPQRPTLGELLRAGPLAEGSIVGMKLGPYRIMRELGRGGAGVVFLAEDRRLRRQVALKVLTPSRDPSPKDRARFAREVKLATPGGPGLIQVLDAGEEQGLLYMTMEFIAGGSLEGRLASCSPQQIVEVVLKVAEALAPVHRAEIVHRDLKPANILMRGEVDPVVTDFGLARDFSESSSLTTTDSILGTPAYMAPEQIEGGEVSCWTDVFALGAILYEGLTGEVPYGSKDLSLRYARQMLISLDPPSKLRPQVPRGLDEVCLRALNPDPRKRYATAEELAAALLPFCASADASTEAAAPSRGVAWPERASLLAALAGALAASACWGVWGSAQEASTPAGVRGAAPPRVAAPAAGSAAGKRRVATDCLLHGVYLEAKGERGRELAELDRALMLDPTWASGYLHRARLRLSRGDQREALEDCDRALDLDPNWTRGYSFRAMLKKRLNDREGAIADFTRVIELDPDYAAAHLNRAVLEEERQRWEEALEDYDRALDLDPNFVAALVYRGQFKAKRENWEGALADSSRALELDPDNATAHRIRELSRARSRDLEGAQGRE